MRAVFASVAPPDDPLANTLRPWTGGRPVLGFSSGRAALYSAIRLAMEQTGRRTVILPAYTSFSVAAAAARADAIIRLVDLDPRSLDFDPEALDAAADESVAAVVLGNLFGFPSDARAVLNLERRGIWVIDDAAQAFGARAGDEWVGTRGNVGVFSFGRGKCVTTGDGGALVLRHASHAEYAARWREPAGRGLGLAVMAAGLKVAAGPHAFALVSRLPGLAVGESAFDADFTIREMSAAARGLAVDVMRRALVLMETRREAATRWREALDRLEWEGPPDGPRTHPAYLRWPQIAPDEATRERAIAALAAAGMPFVRSYPIALNELNDIADRLERGPDMPGAERLARCLLALPCHKDVTSRRVRLAAEALATVAMTRNADS